MSRRTLFTSGDASGQSVVLILFLVLFLCTSLAPVERTARAQGTTAQNEEVKTAVEVAAGLQRAIFTLPLGDKIFVNVPQDLRPGRTVSGTVIAESGGKTEAERDASNGEFRRYVVEIAGQKIPGSGQPFALKVPTSPPVGTLPIVLSGNGREAAKVEFPITFQLSAGERELRLPAFGKSGDIIKVDCACDGVFSDTDYIEIGGKRILPLAESAGSRVAYNTSDVVGPTEIEVSEQGQVVKGRLHNLNIRMSALKTNLMKGEKTKLTVVVTGLEDLKEPALLRLENRTTGVMTMAPSNVQELTIKPADVRPGGRYTTQRALTGITVGDFHITGAVMRRDESPPPSDGRVSPPPTENTGQETTAGLYVPGLPVGSVRTTSTTTETATVTWTTPSTYKWSGVWMICWRKYTWWPWGPTPSCYCTAQNPNVVPPYPYGFEPDTRYIVTVYGYPAGQVASACGDPPLILIGETNVTTKSAPKPNGNPHVLIALGVLLVLGAVFLHRRRRASQPYEGRA